MSNQNSINKFDEALRLFWLESSQTADFKSSEKEMEAILKSNAVTNMNESKQKILIEKLFTTLNSVSLGTLLSEVTTSRSVSDEIVSQQSKIPLKIISDLKTDSIFPNNVPIVLLKNLLKLLDISFQSAEQAIWKTFEIIKKREFVSTYFISGQPSFRHRQNNPRESLIKVNSKTDGKELFENEEALKKYLSKLGDLMKTN